MKRCTLAMFSISAFLVVATLSYGYFLSTGIAAETADPQKNPAIDMKGHLQIAEKAANHRESRRISEDEFIRMSQEEGTIILDARSKEKYDQLHIKGAVNLSFSDISVETLKTTLPNKSARILIYCNNNFKGAKFTRARGPFETKTATASLNLSTYITLYDYGYENVYELGPQLDPEKSKLTFEPVVVKN